MSDVFGPHTCNNGEAARRYEIGPAITYEEYMARKLSPHGGRVKKFMRLANQVLPDSPTVPNGRMRELRVRLLMEELLEFAYASDVEITTQEGGEPLCFKDLHFKTYDDVDIIGVADGLADLSVVTVGAMLAYGIADEALLEEVDSNNLKKFGPGGHKHPETGKWIKPPDHQPPDIAAVLQKQGWCSNEGGAHEGNGKEVSVQGNGHE